MHITTRKLAAAAVTGAAYAALTMLLAPISYGAIQCRISEVLCILPFFIPCTAWGLFAGCAIANLLSAAGILIMALSFWLASRFTLHTTHGHILFILYLRGFGMGLTFAPLNLFSLKNLTQQDMAAAAGISNSIKQLAGSIGIALLTVIFSARTSYHAAHETVSAAQTYVEGVTDALRVVAVITLAALLPLLGVFRKKRPGKSGVKGAATPSPGEAVSGKTDKTTIYRTKPE